MYLHTVVISAVALLSVVQCRPEANPEDGMKKLYSVESNQNITNGEGTLIGLVNSILALYVDSSKTYHKGELANFVADKLSTIKYQRQSDLPLVNLEKNSLPMLFNMTVIELDTTGPTPEKHTGFYFHQEVYGKKDKEEVVTVFVQSLVSRLISDIDV